MFLAHTTICDICGNDIKPGSSVCPFCGSRQAPGELPGCAPRSFLTRTVNLERGMPHVDEALKRLDHAVSEARITGVTVLTIIHGYGSSGTGGKIRTECRKKLDFMQSRRQIKSYLPGESFSSRTGPGKDLLRRFPRLSGDANLDKGNRGVTLIVI